MSGEYEPLGDGSVTDFDGEDVLVMADANGPTIVPRSLEKLRGEDRAVMAEVMRAAAAVMQAQAALSELVADARDRGVSWSAICAWSCVACGGSGRAREALETGMARLAAAQMRCNGGSAL